jgi:hypothetical protein
MNGIGMRLCSIEGCEKKVKAMTWCSMHYTRWKTHGDTSVCTTNRYIPMLERFWMKVQKGTSCWIWTGGSSNGYGLFTESSKGKTHIAHRFSYEQTVGPIPDGLHLDHRCRNRRCVNPDHLRPVTNKQNGEHRGGARRDSTTGVLGVHLSKKDKRYYTYVDHYGERHTAGAFSELDEAAEAARQLRLSLFTHNDLDRKTA